MKKIYLLTALAFASLGVSAQKQKLAAKEMNVLWERLDLDIKECISYIKGDREKLSKYFL